MKPLLPFPRRGLYIHLCWNYFRPYSPRGWSAQDWADYLDWCVRIGYNRFMIWPLAEAFMEKHRRADQRAFAALNRIVADAKRRHPHLEFWGVLIPNCVTAQKFDAPLYQRDFFAAMRPVDPQSRRAMAVVEKRRAAALECLPDFDGWAIIDGDPGGWPNRPVKAFIAVMEHARKQVSQSARAGSKARFIYWMWTAWGHHLATGEARKKRWREFIRLLDDRIGAENWHPLPGGCTDSEEAGRLIAELGRCRTATRLWYNSVENEPGPPFTHTTMGDVAQAVRRARAEGPWDGFMVNAQNHLLQLPRIWYAAQWMLGKRPDPAKVLDNAAATFCPRAAAAWQRLRAAQREPPRADGKKAGAVPRPKRIFDPTFLVRDCAQQAAVVTAGRRLADAMRKRQVNQLDEKFARFLRRSYDRYRTTGYYGALNGSAFSQWWNYAGIPPISLLEEIRAAWEELFDWSGCEFMGALGQIVSKAHADLIKYGAPPLLAAVMIQQLLGRKQPQFYLTERLLHA